MPSSRAVAWCLPLLGAPAPALAQDAPEPPLALPPVRVEAPSAELFGIESVRREVQLPQDFLVEDPVRFLPDALAESAGIGLQRTGPGQSSPFLRGFTGLRTLFVLDGFRFNHSAWREGPNQYLMTVDEHLLERLEVRYGSGSVRYGPDAVGGTVVMDSKAPGPSDPDRDHTGEFHLRLASAERSVIAHEEFGGRLGDRLLYRLGLTRKDFGDLSGGRHVGVQEGTAFESASGDAGLTWRLAEDLDLVFRHQVDRQEDAPRTHRTVDGIAWHGTVPGSDLRRDFDQERDFTSLRLFAGGLGGAVERLGAGLGFHSQDETEDRVRSDGRRTDQGFDVNATAAFVDLESETAFGRLLYGIDHVHDNVNSFRNDFAADGSFAGSSVQGPVADDARYDLSGAFLEAEIDPWEPWLVTAGARWVRGAVDAEQVQDPLGGGAIGVSDRWLDWTGELRLLRRLGERAQAYGSVSRAVRMPNLSDLTRFDLARSGEVETPSPGLDPERFTTLELGSRWLGSRLHLEGAAFWTAIRDLIVRFPTGRTIDGLAEVQKANASEGQLWGVEALGSYRFHPHWSTFADVTYVTGRAEAPVAPGVVEDDPLSKLPPLHGHAGVRWEDPGSSLWAEAVVSVADRQDRLSQGDERDVERIPPGGTPGYTVYGIRTGFAVTRRVDVTLAVENLTDRDYRLHGSGINEPGTNVILNVLWRF